MSPRVTRTLPHVEPILLTTRRDSFDDRGIVAKRAQKVFKLSGQLAAIILHSSDLPAAHPAHVP
jgi:hypothetical protein